ncbi:hypothetical protein R1flu_009501 [Riccia fluitans]|uniref:CASP-like protein n=1 Tax=Riccia fluitans TaxID=41844 RepID=A0ABD1Z4T5_9MARC
MKGDTEMGEVTNGYVATPGTVPVSHAGGETSLKRMSKAAIVLRFVAVALCVTSLATMVTDKQTHDFVLTPDVVISKTAKYSSVVAIVAFVYTNAAVAGYSLLQAAFTLMTKSLPTSKLQLWSTFVLDQLVVYVLLGVVGAATEVAYVAEQGEDKILWASQCENYTRFCSQVGASVIFCFMGILTLAAIAAISAKQLFTYDRTSHITRKDGY